MSECSARGVDDWNAYYDHLECLDRRVRHLRGADPTAQFWDVELYGHLPSDDEIVHVRVFKPFSSWLRVANLQTDCANSAHTKMFWDQLLPSDTWITAHGADALIPIEVRSDAMPRADG